ncbi:hypothetical protein B0H13DRAFT_1883408 [Mycena leptocephala]|nr:hypothetical protein B0H13DRAFT_1883408 [Mycena leptocephala]
MPFTIKKRKEWKGFGRKATREMGGEGRNGRQRVSKVGRGGGCSVDTTARMGGEMRCKEEGGGAAKENEGMGEGNPMQLLGIRTTWFWGMEDGQVSEMSGGVTGDEGMGVIEGGAVVDQGTWEGKHALQR